MRTTLRDLHRAHRVRDWALWELPRWLVVFIAAVTLADLAAIALAATTLRPSAADLMLAAILTACTAATVEFTKRAGENAGLIKDVYAIWELPLAILLSPIWALLVPALRFCLIQWRIRRIPAHRRVFSAAVVGLSYAAASAVFHTLTGTGFGNVGFSPQHAGLWLAAVAVAGLAQWGVNTTLLFPAIKGSDPTVSLRDLYLGREQVQNDVAELSVAALVTLGIAVTPLTILLAFPFVTLLQRSFRHAQLLNASRVDSKTGLLNAGTWEREAVTEIARAVRTGTSLAVALVDLDHFKAVNDAYGHLAGDRALKAVARTFKIFVRDYDMVGRFGGEEFALLFPQTVAVDALGIAERMRQHIASMPFDVADGPESAQVRLTVSIGVAALSASAPDGTSTQLTDLLAAADRALYRAKRGGRDQVCMVTDTATIGSPALGN